MADRYFTMKVRLSPWAKWIAQDENGEWWEYKSKPIVGTNAWTGEDMNKIAQCFPPKDFTKELYEVK